MGSEMCIRDRTGSDPSPARPCGAQSVRALPRAAALSAPVPVTVVTGALGVGKTTALLELAAHRPADARWVVLVNEFGEVGIDGALLGDADALDVAELPGGCLCCAAQGPMRATLRRILDTLQPDRVLIEPSGVADTGALLDVLTEDFAGSVVLEAVITLVDPCLL